MVTAGNIKNGLPFGHSTGRAQAHPYCQGILLPALRRKRPRAESPAAECRLPAVPARPVLCFRAAAGNMPYRCVQVRDALPDRTVEGLRQGPGEDFIIAGQFAAVIRTNQVRGTAPGNLMTSPFLRRSTVGLQS